MLEAGGATAASWDPARTSEARAAGAGAVTARGGDGVAARDGVGVVSVEGAGVTRPGAREEGGVPLDCDWVEDGGAPFVGDSNEPV